MERHQINSNFVKLLTFSSSENFHLCTNFYGFPCKLSLPRFTILFGQVIIIIVNIIYILQSWGRVQRQMYTDSLITIGRCLQIRAGFQERLRYSLGSTRILYTCSRLYNMQNKYDKVYMYSVMLSPTAKPQHFLVQGVQTLRQAN